MLTLQSGDAGQIGVPTYWAGIVILVLNGNDWWHWES